MDFTHEIGSKTKGFVVYPIELDPKPLYFDVMRVLPEDDAIYSMLKIVFFKVGPVARLHIKSSFPWIEILIAFQRI